MDYESSIAVDLPHAEAVSQALELDRSIGVLLPCNVVVSTVDSGSKVRILDPQVLASVTGRDDMAPIAEEASRRLSAVLDTFLR